MSLHGNGCENGLLKPCTGKLVSTVLRGGSVEIRALLPGAVVQAILEELSMANPLQELIDERVARGEIEGRIEGKREALRTVLQGRFGTLPEAVEQRIAAADVDQLDAFIGRAATVARPDEL